MGFAIFTDKFDTTAWINSVLRIRTRICFDCGLYG